MLEKSKEEGHVPCYRRENLHNLYPSDHGVTEHKYREQIKGESISQKKLKSREQKNEEKRREQDATFKKEEKLRKKDQTYNYRMILKHIVGC